jgi:hypothetical protein
MVTDMWEWNKDNTKIITANNPYHALGHMLMETYVNHSFMVSLYETKIRPIVTSVAE